MSNYKKHLTPLIVFAVGTLITCSHITLEKYPEVSCEETIQKRSVAVECTMEPKDLEVSYWGIGYLPDSFSLTGDGKGIFSYEKKQPTKEHKKTNTILTAHNNIITVEYSYSFARGMYARKNRVKIEIPSTVPKASITFSFNDKNRVIIKGARVLSIDPIK